MSSANYVRTELPTRIAQRLRDMQTLPYVVVTNPHLSHVYELYYKAFETFRRVPEVKSLDDNDAYCAIIAERLKEHLTVIPRLAMGVLECQELMSAEEMDKFMHTLLKSVSFKSPSVRWIIAKNVQRISRRVIAEQHLALTETFNSPWHFPNAPNQPEANADFVGEVFLRCNAREVIESCGKTVQGLAKQIQGSDKGFPEIQIEGHLETTFPYILSHLQYIVGELLRNSFQAIIERFQDSSELPPPIKVLICEAPQHVIIRISDQGGGIPKEVLPHIWSFSKGPRSATRLQNLTQVPKMAATMQELKFPGLETNDAPGLNKKKTGPMTGTSLGSLTARPPNLRLGMGLPMSRIYAEYWAGKLELHSLEGYGVDAFLQISKLGNKNEQLTTRASIDAV